MERRWRRAGETFPTSALHAMQLAAGPIGKEGRSERGEEVGNRSVPMTRLNIQSLLLFTCSKQVYNLCEVSNCRLW